MIEKNIKSRIQQKHDIEANWLKAENFTPMIGEIIVYDADENNPLPRFKIGNGVDNVNTLEFNGSLTVELEDANVGSPNTINADTLGGRNADEFALKSDIENLPTESYDDTELRGLISANAIKIENLKNMIGDVNVSTQVDTAMDVLRQEILGGEW